MGNSDGSIVIDTELDSSDFEQGSKRLHSKIEDAVEKINRLGASIKSAIADALRGITAAPLDTVGQSAQEVQGRVDELGRSKSLSQLQSQISTVNRQITELEDKLAQGDAAKAPFIQQAEELRQRIKDARAEVEQYRQAWVNGVPGADKSQSEAQEKAARLSAQYNEVVAQIDKMDASLGRTGSKLDGLRQKAAALAAQLQAATSPASGGEPPDQMTPLAERIRGAFTSAFEATRNAAKGFAVTVKTGFSRIASAAKKAAKSVLSFGKSQRKTDAGLRSGFMTMLKYAFGIRSLFVLFNRLRNAIKEGFGNLAQFSDRTNAAISGMMSALTQFKNSIAAAFDPILRIAAPALTQLINLLTQAATKLGVLLAVLTGQKTFIRAKEVQEDYAASLSGTANAAKDLNKANKSLGIDELHVLTDDSESDTGGSSTSPADMFEEAEVPGVFDGFADALANIWQVFRDAWKSKGQSVVDAAQQGLAALKQTALDVGAAFYAVWTEGPGQAFVEGVLGGVRSLLNLVTAFAAAFDKAWTSAGRGEGLIRAILTMMTEVVNTVTAIGDSFAAVWNNGTGAAVWANILEIITNVNTVIGNLAANFRKAWEDDSAGERIWQALLDMANDVLAAINQITGATANWASKLNFGPLVNAFGALLDAMEPLVALISEGLAWVWENVLLPFGTWTIEAAAPALLEALGAGFEVLTAALETLQPFATAVWNDFLQPLAQWTGETVVSAIGTVKDAFTDLLAWFNGDMSLTELGYTLARDFGGLAISLVTGIGEAILNVDWGIVVAALGTVAVSIVGGFVDLILGALAGVVDLLADGFSALGLDSVAGFLQGIADGLLGIGAWIKANVIDPVVNWFKSLLGIHSPSTVFAEMGDFVVQGFLQGISNAWSGVIKFFTGAISALTSMLSTAWTNIKSTASTAWSGIKSTVTNAFEGAKNGLISIAGGIQSGLSTTWTSIKSTASSAWDSVKTTASTKWTNISTTVMDLWNGLKTDLGSVHIRASTIRAKYTKAKNMTSSLS